MTPLIDINFQATPDICYIATCLDDILDSASRPGLTGADEPESDKNKELIENEPIVNLTLSDLVCRCGNIDCGGANRAVVRYVNFHEADIPVYSGRLPVRVGYRRRPHSHDQDGAAGLFGLTADFLRTMKSHVF